MFNLDNIYKEEKFLIFRIVNFNLVVIFVYFNFTTDVSIKLTEISQIVDNLKQKYTDLKIIFCGDFNARLGVNNSLDEESGFSFEFSSLTPMRNSLDQVVNDRGRQLLNFMEEEGYLILNGRTPSDPLGKFTFCSKVGNSVIDQAWINQDALDIVWDFWIADETPSLSDHFPIKIKLKYPLRQPFLKLEYTSIRWLEQLKENYLQYLGALESFSCDTLNENEILTMIQDAIYAFARENNLFKKYYKNNFCWWADEEYRGRKRDLVKSIKICKANTFKFKKDVEYWEICKTNLAKLKKIKIKTMFSDRIERILRAGTTKEYWDNLNFLRKRGRATSGAISFREWEQYYKGIFPARSEYIFDLESRTVEVQDAYFSLQELDSALKGAKSRKAAGRDGIPSEFYKFFNLKWKTLLLAAFNKILDREITPDGWSGVLISMLFKKGDVSNPENYRPIALINSIVKLFTQIMYNRLSNWVERNGVLPEFQSGFRKGRGCLDNIFTLNSLIQYHLNQPKGKLFALFIDFRRAFPSVNHGLLWSKLHSVGISSKIIKILISLYSKAYMHVKIANSLSAGIDVTEGVLQGEILSPLLFAIFLADLEVFLKTRGISGITIQNFKRILILAYADDIVILSQTWGGMEDILALLLEYCQLNHFQINTSKTNVVVFRRGGRNFKRSGFAFGDSFVTIAKRYEYLGVVFDNRCLLAGAAQSVFTKASKASSDTRALIKRAKLHSIDKIHGLFGALVASVVSYGSQVWAVRHLDCVDRIQTSFYKKLFLLPNNTPNYAVRNEFERYPISCLIFKLIIRWLHKVLAMSDDRYPRIALHALFLLLRDPNSQKKYNWLMAVKNTFLDPLGEGEVFDGDLGVLASDVVRSRLIEKYIQFRRTKDLEKSLCSSSLVSYPFLVQQVVKYLKIKLDLREKSLLAQLRLINKYNERLIYKGKIYVLRQPLVCQFCNMGNVDLFHYLMDCPMLVEQRKSLSSVHDNQNLKDKIASLFNSSVSSMHNFIKFILYLCEVHLLNNIQIFT